MLAPFPSVPSKELSELSYSVTGKPLAKRVVPEMLHSVVPDIYDPKRRRRIVHTSEFLKREQRFPHYTRARRWEAENLARFLR